MSATCSLPTLQLFRAHLLRPAGGPADGKGGAAGGGRGARPILVEFLYYPDFVVTQDMEAGAHMMADRYDVPPPPADS